MTSVPKKDFLRFLEGHKQANVVIAQERAKRLSSLTPEQSRKEYDGLCDLWYRHPKSPMPERLEAWRVQFKIGLRKKFDKAGSRPFIQ